MKKIAAKLTFDILLTVMWIILMVYPITSNFWHEVLGIATFLLFVIHIAYNARLILYEVPHMFKRGTLW